MKFQRIISTGLLLLTGLMFCLSTGAQAQDDKLVLDLSGAWYFEGVLPGEGIKKQFHTIEPDCGTALVPGDVYTDHILLVIFLNSHLR